MRITFALEDLKESISFVPRIMRRAICQEERFDPLFPPLLFLVSLKKELHFRYKIVSFIIGLAIYHKEVFADEKHMAITGSKKPPEHAC